MRLHTKCIHYNLPHQSPQQSGAEGADGCSHYEERRPLYNVENITYILGRIEGLALSIHISNPDDAAVGESAKQIESLASQVAEDLIARMSKICYGSDAYKALKTDILESHKWELRP